MNNTTTMPCSIRRLVSSSRLVRLALLSTVYFIIIQATEARPVPCPTDPTVFGYSDWTALRMALHDRKETDVTLCPGAVLDGDSTLTIDTAHTVLRCGNTNTNNAAIVVGGVNTTTTTTYWSSHGNPAEGACVMRGGATSHLRIVNTTNVTLQGLTFARAPLTSVRVSGSATADITFVDCTWYQNVVPLTTSGAAALEIVHGHNVVVEHSRFVRNGGGLHGAIRIRQETLVIDGCVFYANLASQFVLGGWIQPTWTRGAAVSVGQDAETMIVVQNALHDTLVAQAVIQNSCFSRHDEGGYGTIYVAPGSTLEAQNNHGVGNQLYVQGITTTPADDPACHDIVWLQNGTTTCLAFDAITCAVPPPAPQPCPSNSNMTGLSTAWQLRSTLEWYQGASTITLCPSTAFALDAFDADPESALAVLQSDLTLQCGVADSSCVIRAAQNGGHWNVTTTATNTNIRGMIMEGAINSPSVVVQAGADVSWQSCVWRQNRAMADNLPAVAVVQQATSNFASCQWINNRANSILTLTDGSMSVMNACTLEDNVATSSVVTIVDGGEPFSNVSIQNSCFLNNEMRDGTVYVADGNSSVIQTGNFGLDNTLSPDASHSCVDVWVANLDECRPFGNMDAQCLEAPPTPLPTSAPTSAPTTLVPTASPTGIQTNSPTTMQPTSVDPTPLSPTSVPTMHPTSSTAIPTVLAITSSPTLTNSTTTTSPTGTPEISSFPSVMEPDYNATDTPTFLPSSGRRNSVTFVLGLLSLWFVHVSTMC